MSSELLTERRDTTLVLTVRGAANRNSLSAQACAAGIEAINNAADEPGIHCIVLHGDGAHFCAGADPHALGHDEAGPGGFEAAFDGLIDVMRSSPKPVIAAVEGHAVDAGFVLALACDVVIAADDACFSWTQPQAAAALTLQLPRPLAMQLLWLTEALSARRLHGMGLANEVVPPGEALAEALRWGRKLAGVPADRIAAAKEWFRSRG
ncbi:enoyl-CoA hydratase-related protein [Aquincola tertiaricarbonis]|uniref:enoyl-CoA hydratase-related protein n=1 Tax=Aquincola tertiaricarbonis TaxID=391953 RepID=UPI000ADCAEA1|nr:enoyl-CoA hydratase-related protein [Aquincola tertiaricarbonis]